MPCVKGRLPDEQYNKIQSNYTELVADIKYDPMGLARSLFKYHVFDDDDLEKIKREERHDEGCKSDAAAKLLDILLNCGSLAYDNFIKALDDNKYYNALFQLEPGFKRGDKDSKTSNGLFNTPLGRGTGIFQLGSIPPIQENIRTFTHLEKKNEDSPRLRTMKDDTRNLLHDVLKNSFVKTRAFEEGLKILKNHSVLGIIGAAGDGKTTLSMMIAYQFIQDNQQYTPLMIDELDDLNHVSFNDDKYLLIIDDMYGKFNTLKDRTDKWPKKFENFRIRREKGQLAFVYIMRDYIYNSSKYQLDKYRLFSENTTQIFLHKGDFSLTEEEKRQFLDFYKISSDTIISKIKGCFGFPAISSLCGKFKNESLPNNLGSSHDFLLAELNTFWKENKDIYSTLLVVFCLHAVRKEDLKLESPKGVRELVNKIIEHVYKGFDLNIAKENVKELSETFIKLVERNYMKMFSLRDFVEAPFLYHFSGQCMEMALEYCSFELLMSLTKMTRQANDQFIIINKKFYHYFSLRCLKELKNKNTGIFLHPAFLDNTFLTDFLTMDEVEVLLSDIETISLGQIQGIEECGNFVHYISLYGDLECLLTVLGNLKEHMLNNEKTNMNWDVMGLAAISMIEPIEKLNFLRQHNYGDIVTLPHQAVYSGRFDVVQHVASFTVFDPKSLDNKSRTILHNACDSNHDVVEIIDFLIDNGFDVNAQDVDGYTPLHLAVARGKKQNVSILITRGASVRTLDNNNRLPIHVICSVDDGWDDIDVSGILNQLIEAGSPINSSDQRGLIPLQEAVFNVNRNCIYGLLNIKHMFDIADEIIQSIMNDASQLSDNTLFRSILGELKRQHLKIDKMALCSRFPSLDNLQALLSVGVDFHALDASQCSILHASCKNGTIETVKFLINEVGLDIRHRNKNGQTPATYCCLSKINPVEKLKIFLSKNSAALDVLDNDYHSLLHVSCMTGLTETVKYLVNKIGLNVNQKDIDGLTPAGYCVLSDINPVDKLKLILSKGGNLDIVDKNNCNLLHLSCDEGIADTVKYLVNEIRLDPNHKDINGATPVAYCASSNISPVDKLEFLSSKGGKLDTVDKFNRSLLHVSCAYGTIETVMYLINEIKLDVNDTDNIGRTPLMYCSISNISPVDKLKFLLSKTGKLDIVDDDNRSLLHVSCQHGTIETVKYLVNETRLHVNQKERNGFTPLVYCAMSTVNPVEKLVFFKSKKVELDAVDKDNRSLLHASCGIGDITTVNYLVNEIKLNVNHKDSFGLTPAGHSTTSPIQPVEKLKFLRSKGVKLDTDDLLHLSCRYGTIETVNFLVNQIKLDVNNENSSGETPAWHCIESSIKPVEKLKFLKSKGGKLDFINNDNFSLLYHSFERGTASTVNYLVNEIGFETKHKIGSGKTPAVCCAISNINPVEKLKILLSKGFKLDVVDDDDSSLLHDSCTEGKIETVNYLINEIGLDINHSNRFGLTPATYCCRSTVNPVEKLKILFSKRCKKRAFILLMDSCEFGTLATVKYLLNKMRIDISKVGFSLAPYCIKSDIDPVQKLKFLLSNGASFDIEGINVLLYCCCRFGTAVETLEFLMGLDVHSPDVDPNQLGTNLGNGKDSLLLDCFKTDCQKREKIKFLISKGATITICRPYKEFYKDDLDHCTYPLHHSCYIGTLDTVKFLVNDAGYDVNFTNHKNMTSLFWCFNSQIEQIGKINFLTSKGAKITICRPYKDFFKDDFDGCTYPLHHSCYIGTLDTVKFLVNDAGYDVNFTNHKNMTSLFCCFNSQIEQMEKINFLISKGAKITICRP